MARRQTIARRNRAQEVAKRTVKTAGRRAVRYARAAADGVQRAARTVAHKVGDLASAARRNPGKTAIATGAAAVVVAAAVRARRRRKRW
jgi:hypothetical protein